MSMIPDLEKALDELYRVEYNLHELRKGKIDKRELNRLSSRYTAIKSWVKEELDYASGEIYNAYINLFNQEFQKIDGILRTMR